MRAAWQRGAYDGRRPQAASSQSITCFFEPAGHWSLQKPWHRHSRAPPCTSPGTCAPRGRAPGGRRRSGMSGGGPPAAGSGPRRVRTLFASIAFSPSAPHSGGAYFSVSSSKARRRQPAPEEGGGGGGEEAPCAVKVDRLLVRDASPSCAAVPVGGVLALRRVGPAVGRLEGVAELQQLRHHRLAARSTRHGAHRRAHLLALRVEGRRRRRRRRRARDADGAREVGAVDRAVVGAHRRQPRLAVAPADEGGGRLGDVRGKEIGRPGARTCRGGRVPQRTAAVGEWKLRTLPSSASQSKLSICRSPIGFCPSK